MTARKRVTVTEARVVAETMVALSAIQGALVWRNNTGVASFRDRAVRFGLRGSADILACVRGRFVAIEAKSRAGRQTSTQLLFEEAVARAGGCYILARDVETVLSTLLNEGIILLRDVDAAICAVANLNGGQA